MTSDDHRATARPGATSRLAEVAPERVPGWVRRFTASHGAVSVVGGTETVEVGAGDGARAVLGVPWPPLDLEGDDPITGLADHAALPRTAALLLVRRGGFAAGLARDGALLDHSGGTRHVQGRTAAGGWSQQRYARRRANQATALVGAAAGALEKVLARAAHRPDVLVVGGDRSLVDQALAGSGLAALASLPRGPLLDVPDPRHGVLVEAARRARAVRVIITDGPVR